VTDQYFFSTPSLIVVILIVVDDNDLYDYQLVVPRNTNHDKNLLTGLKGNEIYSFVALILIFVFITIFVTIVVIFIAGFVIKLLNQTEK
jgi:uncharacterized membrane protein SpoIIM required for sporulation